MPKTRLILVGGFLGAGKTTLLAQAAQRLSRQGQRVGLVANDQAADLVDTELLKETGSRVEEVAGGCFCCRFPDMITAMERLVREASADVLIGEPVGSCTDLSATVLQPLKKLHGHQFDVAPFSVLVDANQVRVLDRLRQAAREPRAARFPDNVLYIYQKQLEEADLIVLNKADLLSAGRVGGTQGVAGRAVSRHAAGDHVGPDRRGRRRLARARRPGPAGGPEDRRGGLRHLRGGRGRPGLDERLGEAARRRGRRLDRRLPATCSRRFARELAGRSAEIAHLKLYLTARRRPRVGQPDQQRRSRSRCAGSIAPATRDTQLLVNARVHAQPDRLRAVVENRLQSVAGRAAHRGDDHQRAELLSRPAAADPPVSAGGVDAVGWDEERVPPSPATLRALTPSGCLLGFCRQELERIGLLELAGGTAAVRLSACHRELPHRARLP